MRIAIDARFDKHGIGTYTRELIHHLSRIDRENHYVIFCSSKEQSEKYNFSHQNFKSFVVPAPIFSAKEQLYLPYYIKKKKIDLFHATLYVFPIIHPCFLIVTIHDLLCKTNPSFYPPAGGIYYYIERAYYNFMNWYAIRSSKCIITVSDFAKREIVHFFPAIPGKKITVIHNGVGPQFCPGDPWSIEKIKAKYQIDGKYILFTGTLSPRKNLVNVIRAFSDLTSLRDQNYKLVVASKKDSRYPAPFQIVEQLKLKKDVLFIGYVSKEDLAALYAGAEVFVLPSFHESFGLPIVEAFACGVPVITSNLAALPEVAGNAALFIDPHNIAELKESMLRVVSDRAFRNTLIERGFSRVGQFSWTRAAERVLEIYEKVLESKAK
jgi:glycosyltransferase involved in cell wall biosynthesis